MLVYMFLKYTINLPFKVRFTGEKCGSAGHGLPDAWQGPQLYLQRHTHGMLALLS